MTGKRKTNASYDVGYGKPPEHSRFRKGQSGNPRGRPRKVQAAGETLETILGQTITVREGDIAIRVSKQHALLMSLLSKAIKGDTRAASLILRTKEAQDQARAGAPSEASLPELPIDKRVEEMTEEELDWAVAVLSEYMRRHTGGG